MAELLKGAPVAASIDLKTAELVNELAKEGKAPKLVLVRVGEKEADLSYERNIMKRCEKTGVQVEKRLFDLSATTEKLVASIEELNADPGVHGVLFFMPFPKECGIDERKVREALVPDKDVDGCTSSSLAGVFMDSGVGFAPCTAQAVMEILSYYDIPLEGKDVAVVGRSLVVGKPAAMLLLKKNATVTLCHSRTKDLAEVTKKAQILVAAIGKAEFIGDAYLSPDQVIVDAGINWNEAKQKLCGDVDAEAAEAKSRAFTPVPGGVGGVTTSVLAYHTALAAK